MPRRRSLSTMERDAQVADLYRRGRSYRQIAAELGYKSTASVAEALRRAALDAARDSVASAEALTLMLERLQDYRRVAWRVAEATHYATTSGGVAIHPDTGDALLDDGPTLQALDRLVKFDDMEAKLRGIYAPVKSRVEVITEDAVDAAIALLEDELTQNGGTAAPKQVASS